MKNRFATPPLSVPLSGGFTLVELLLVLTVLALLAGMAAPLLQDAFQENTFLREVDRVRHQMARTRLHAVDTGVTYQFRYEPEGRRFLVIPFELDADLSAKDGDLSGNAAGGTSLFAGRYPVFSGQLPEGLQFKSVAGENSASAPEFVLPVAKELLAAFPDASELEGVSWSQPVLFYPDGEAVEAALEIRDEHKRTVTLTVRSLTGAVSVSSVTKGKG